MSDVERDSPFGAFEDTSVFEQLRTVRAALESGLVNDDMQYVEEAALMLDDALRKIEREGYVFSTFSAKRGRQLHG